MFKMKTKIIFLLFIVVFISSSILLYMITSTFKKDKISYVYDVITSQTQTLSHQLQSEIESIEMQAASLSQKSKNSENTPDHKAIQYFSISQVKDQKLISLSEITQPDYVRNPALDEIFLGKIKDFKQVDQKLFFSYEQIFYQLILNQSEPEKIITIIAFDSEIAKEVNDLNKDQQYSFILDADMNTLAGQAKNLIFFADFVSKNKTKKWSDLQSGQLLSSANESWIYSMTTVNGTELKILNLVSEKKAFSVMKTIYIKSVLSFILILSLVVIIGILSATYLTKKLNQLVTATKKVTAGELDTEINVTGKDEIASLSNDFNHMVKQIKKLISETAEQARMENELKTAQLVQENLFPSANQTYANCSIAGYCRPATECGGDWWFHSEDENNVNVIIADATGHGVPAALMTSAIKAAFTLTAKLNLSAVDTLTKINEALCEVGRNKVMMTAFYIRINKKTNLAEYINASHEAPFILDLNLTPIDKTQLVFLNEKTSARLGQSSDTVYQSCHIQLLPYQRLFLYTDGIFDLKNSDQKNLTERSFYKNVLEFANQKTHLNIFSTNVTEFLFDYNKQKNLDDDVTLCHIEII